MTEKTQKITIRDDSYPKNLKKIKNPPKVLYYKGILPSQNEKCFSIVGTRNYSPYGKQIAFDISKNLAKAGLTIVSGLAPGIDTFCHEAVVESKKRTIAVLGTGLDEKSIYPKQNTVLSRKIIENGGCLISEYEDGTPGSKFTFPQRNRIISGLSFGVLVVEAKEKSGSLITANYAKQQKRKIFAVPGSIYSSNSKGCHFLLRQGAKLTENANDILIELKDAKLLQEAMDLSGDNAQENLILKALKEDPLYIDKIIEKTKLSAPSVSSALAILEIKGKVRNLGQNIWTIER